MIEWTAFHKQGHRNFNCVVRIACKVPVLASISAYLGLLSLRDPSKCYPSGSAATARTVCFLAASKLAEPYLYYDASLRIGR